MRKNTSSNRKKSSAVMPNPLIITPFNGSSLAKVNQNRLIEIGKFDVPLTPWIIHACIAIIHPPIPAARSPPFPRSEIFMLSHTKYICVEKGKRIIKYLSFIIRNYCSCDPFFSLVLQRVNKYLYPRLGKHTKNLASVPRIHLCFNLSLFYFQVLERIFNRRWGIVY